MTESIFGVTSMHGFTPWLSLTGGILIGVAALALLYFNGRIAGVSGILAGVLSPSPGDTLWRVIFIAGLLSGAVVIQLLHAPGMAIEVDVSLSAIVLGGFLVGLGTRIGAGCTSGHGVCGVGRLAPRSIVASVIFVCTGILTSYFVRHVLGGV